MFTHALTPSSPLASLDLLLLQSATVVVVSLVVPGCVTPCKMLLIPSSSSFSFSLFGSGGDGKRSKRREERKEYGDQ